MSDELESIGTQEIIFINDPRVLAISDRDNNELLVSLTDLINDRQL